jgi:hypothetical protein
MLGNETHCRQCRGILRTLLPAGLTLLLAIGHAAASEDPAAVRAASESLPQLEQILERYVEALGGRQAIQSLTTRVMKGRRINDLSSRNPPVYTVDRVEVLASLPDRYLLLARSGAEITRDVWDGRLGWRQNSRGVTRDDRLGRSRLAWLFNPHNALLMREYFPGMELRGLQVLSDRLVYVVETAYEFDLYFDAETALLVRLGYNRELSDYREVDGVLVPHRLSISRKGGASTYYFDSVEHHGFVSESRFARPVTGP